MKGTSTVAKLYAKAIFELADERSSLEKVFGDFSQFIELLRGSPDLFRALNAFMFTAQEREKIAEQLADKMQLHPMVLQAIRLLIEKNRLEIYEDIFTELRALVDRKNNRVRGTVTTVESLTEAQREELSKAFETKLGKQVILEPVINKEILGGLIVEVHGQTFDGSLKTTIRRLRENLERQSL